MNLSTGPAIPKIMEAHLMPGITVRRVLTEFKPQKLNFQTFQINSKGEGLWESLGYKRFNPFNNPGLQSDQ